MPAVFDKLQLKSVLEIVVVDAPPGFESELKKLDSVKILRSASRAKGVQFALAFVTRQSDIDRLASELTRKAEGDAAIWFAYPKQSSKRFKCEFNRDSGWQSLGDAGYEPVRMVAIDEDWSAVRFRKVEFIKKLTRGAEHALSRQGKARTRST